MRKLLVTLFIGIVSFGVVIAESYGFQPRAGSQSLNKTQTYRDASGRPIGTSQVDRSGNTQFRDSSGRPSYSIRKDGTVLDSSGRPQGSIRDGR